MRGVIINSHGSVDVLEFREDLKEPICLDNQIKVNIKATSINHLDIWVRKGIPGIKIPLPMILGSDGAGVIVEVGKDVKSFHPGDKVVIQPGTYSKDCNRVKRGLENFSNTYGILGETEPGVQCDYVVLNPENIYPMPNHLTFEDASSMQLAFMTAYQMLVKRALLKPFETVLVYGGTSGIGTAAIQIAKDLGARVITTVGSDSKFDHAFKFGADYVVNHSKKDWFKEIRKSIKNDTVDVIFEHIGAETWDTSTRLLGIGGRIVTCGATTGYRVNIDLRYLFSKQQSIIGSTMSDISTFNEVQKKIEQGTYIPFVDKVYNMKDVKDAHLYIERRKNMGKVVLQLD